MLSKRRLLAQAFDSRLVPKREGPYWRRVWAILKPLRRRDLRCLLEAAFRYQRRYGYWPHWCDLFEECELERGDYLHRLFHACHQRGYLAYESQQTEPNANSPWNTKNAVTAAGRRFADLEERRPTAPRRRRSSLAECVAAGS